MPKESEIQKALSQLPSEVRALIDKLPGIAEVKGLEFIDDNFVNQGFTDQANKPWEKRKKRPGRKAQQQDEGRAILVKSGAMRRSWQNDTKIVGMAIHFTSNRIYTERHNEGLKTTPQRQMIGESEKLNQMIFEPVDKRLKKIYSK